MKVFLLECRRRRVFQVAAFYIIGAWVVVQVADLVFEAWELPPALLRRVWIAAFIGFPFALLFGWRFDIVGGRIVRTPASDSSPDLALQRSDYLILALFAVAVIAGIYDIGSQALSARSESAEPPRAAYIDPRSIAVLPFASTDSDNDLAGFLAVGIQDDLLTRLSKIAALKVISRTSVERYRDTTEAVPSIAAALGVGKILEGGVQSVGDKIRVNVQLIDGQSDTHLWAETYDRDLTAADLFVIQTQIVEEIVAQLHASLTPQEEDRLGSMPTQSLAAYTEYLKGLKRSEAESMEAFYAAIEYYEKAIGIDPNFALAYVAIADAYLTLALTYIDGPTDDEATALAEPPLVKALTLDPNLGQAHATLGLLRQQQGDFAAAEEAYRKSIALQPNYSRAYRLYARLRRLQGRSDDARRLILKAVDLDPYSAPVNFDYGRILDDAGEFDAARDQYQRVIEIEPDHAMAHVYMAAIHYLVYGAVDESLIWYHRAAVNDPLSASLRSGQAFAYMELGDLASARRWVDEAVRLDPNTFWPRWASLRYNLLDGNDQAALADARAMLNMYPRNATGLNVLRIADLKAGRYEAARQRYARAYRELTEPAAPEVDINNYIAAMDLALVLIRLGDQQRADKLLTRSLEVLGNLHRLGTTGYFIADVQIYALQGRKQEALRALREAIDEGWRMQVWYQLEYNPNLASIRDDPEFKSLYASVQADLAVQADRVRDLQASGEL